MSRLFQVQVWPLAEWLDARRLLGPGAWQFDAGPGGRVATAGLDRAAAADLTARLRGVGLGGRLISIKVTPSLNRKELRKAHAEEARRYRQGSPGFSRRGARLDEEGRKSLTPEALALQLGERAGGLRVIDACAGAGGNAIGFARAGCTVIAIELDPARLEMARQNASLYGVADRIEFIQGDATEIVPGRQADLLFIDPPWGARYDKERVTLEDLSPCDAVLKSAQHIAQRWVKAPPSFDPATLPGYHVSAAFGVGAGDDRRVKFLLLERPSGDLRRRP